MYKGDFTDAKRKRIELSHIVKEPDGVSYALINSLKKQFRYSELSYVINTLTGYRVSLNLQATLYHRKQFNTLKEDIAKAYLSIQEQMK